MEEIAAPAETSGYTKADQLALRVLQIGAIAAVLVALPNPTFDLDRFLVPKELALHVTAVLAGILALGSIRRIAITGTDWLLFAYLILSALSAITATNRWLGVRALAVTASSIAIFWTARALSRAGLASPLLNGLALAVVIAAATALVQAYGLRTDFFAQTRVPGGTLGNRNFIAHVAAFGLPLCFLAALRTKRFLLTSTGVAIVSAALVLTRSRAAWLAGGVMLLIFVVSTRMWRRFFGVLVFAAAGVAGALLIPNTLRWRGENPYLQSVRGVANYEEGSGRGRLVQYEHSLRMAASHALLGVGPGNWPVEYPKYAARDDASLNPSEPGMTFNPWPSSDWVALVSERGLAGALLMVLICVGIAIRGLRHDDRLLGGTLLAMLAAAVVAGLFDAVLLLAVPALIVWAALGALWPVEPMSAVRGPRLALALVVILLAGVGAYRSAAQVAAMELYAAGNLERASRVDPGNYRIHLRLARRCDHARAAHALFPSSAEAREISRRCR